MKDPKTKGLSPAKSMRTGAEAADSIHFSPVDAGQGCASMATGAKPISPAQARKIPIARKPRWIRTRPLGGPSFLKITELLKHYNLHTVCAESKCPNLAECWAGGTATLMIGSDTCTRACRFCAVKTARRPPPLDPDEPLHVARSIVKLGLKYVVLTSVDRDDLPDGGAGHFAETVRAIKKASSSILVESLVPDFQGDETAIACVVDSGLDVYAHNIETVKRLQARVRDHRAGYEQSLNTLIHAKAHAARQGRHLYTKSSIMLGLGETDAELEEAFDDLRASGVDVVTLGQYLRPSESHLPVEQYLTEEKFAELNQLAQSKGFLYTAAGPMMRSSYRAAEYFMEGVLQKR